MNALRRRLTELANLKTHHVVDRESGQLLGFTNPFVTGQKRSWKDAWTFFKEGRRDKLPPPEVLREVYPIDRTDVNQLRDPPRQGIRVTYIGHATTLIQMDGWTFLTDPVWSQRVGPTGLLSMSRYTPVPFALEELPPLDAVLISHNHFDHLDRATCVALSRRDERAPRLWIVPLGVAGWFREKVPLASGVVELDWWESFAVRKASSSDGAESAVTFVATPTQHWSHRTLFDRNLSLWSGVAVLGDRRRIHFIGDTGYCPAFAEVGGLMGPFDLSLIPCGTYAPRRTHALMHIAPEEAVRIHRDLRSRRSIGIHFGTFGGRKLGHRPILKPPDDLALARRKAGIAEESFVLLRHGETHLFPDLSP